MDTADNTSHFRRVALIWLVATAILTPIVIFVLGPGLPPGNGSVQASGQTADNIVLLALSVPVAMAVLVTLVYEVWVFRERNVNGPVLDGPAITGNSSIQMWWLIITTTLVLFLAGFGSVRLLQDGAGGGQGPTPLVTPAGHALQVQVIAQQWQFTYRFPQYGGVETPDLRLPANTLVEFHVTSLDVVHSFWAYQLGVKADANPGEDNVAYVTTKGPLSVQHSLRRALRRLARLHVRHREGRAEDRLRLLDQERTDPVRARDQVAAALLTDVLPRPTRERWMTATATPAPPQQRRSLLGFNLLTAIVLGIVGYWIAYLLGGLIHGNVIDSFDETGQNDVQILLGYFGGVVGFLAGLGFMNYPLKRMLGHPADFPDHEEAEPGLGKYFRLSTDHKIISMQYMIGIGIFFFVGGLNAMLIRTELLSPTTHVFGANQYLTRGRHARLDDDGHDDVRDPRPVRQLRRAADDRLPPDGVPADRGADLLDADGRRRGADQHDLLRRLPDGLDRLRATVLPGHSRLRRVHRVLRAGVRVDVSARPEPGRDDRDHAGAGDDLVAAADLLLGGACHLPADGSGRTDADSDSADGRFGPHAVHGLLRRQGSAGVRSSGRTSSGCSDTQRCTCWRSQASGSCWS